MMLQCLQSICMKNFLLVLLVLLMILGFGYWFWSFGVVPHGNERYVQLSVEQSGVQVKKPGSDQWEDVSANTKIETGWSVKTNETGLATIRFYDQGESRLDRNSEMVVSEAVAGKHSGQGMKAKITLNAGRVWSRVLRLLDIESAYSVRSSDVVATVRGTAFGIEKNANGGVKVSVGESVVTVASAADPNGKAKPISEGVVASFSASGTSMEEHETTDQERSEGWRVSN